MAKSNQSVAGKSSAQAKVKKDRFAMFRNIIQVLQMTKEYEPRIILFLIAAFLLPVLIFSAVGILVGQFLFMPLIGVLAGILLALMTLSRVADKVGFEQIEGKPGASGAIISQIKFGGVTFEEQPVSVDQKTMDLVFRGSSRAGIIFVTEGPTSRVKKLVDKEIAKAKRVATNVPIHVLNSGNQEGQIPLKKLKKAVVKLKIVLTKNELSQVQKRLRAIGGFSIPIPKGMDPSKMRAGSRRALRGK